MHDQEVVGTNTGVRTMQRPACQKSGIPTDEFEETLSLPVLLTQTIRYSKEKKTDSRKKKSMTSTSRRTEYNTYLYIDKLDECKTPTSHCHLVLDEYNPAHTLGTFFSRTRGIFHCLGDSLWAREGVESPEEKHRCLSISNIAGAVVRALGVPPPLFCRTRTLRIVDLDAASTGRGLRAAFESFVECGCS